MIQIIQHICTGFEDHRQGIYGMVQAMQKSFLRMQEKETISEYISDAKGLWYTTETFGGSPGVHEGIVTSCWQWQTDRRITTISPRKNASEQNENHQRPWRPVCS